MSLFYMRAQEKDSMAQIQVELSAKFSEEYMKLEEVKTAQQAEIEELKSKLRSEEARSNSPHKLANTVATPTSMSSNQLHDKDLEQQQAIEAIQAECDAKVAKMESEIEGLKRDAAISKISPTRVRSSRT